MGLTTRRPPIHGAGFDGSNNISYGRLETCPRAKHVVVASVGGGGGGGNRLVAGMGREL